MGALGLRRSFFVLVTVGVAVLLPGVPASAHPAGLPTATDFRVRVAGVAPAVPGISARFVADGAQLELRNDSDHAVEVLGYQGEPFWRIDRDGAWRNTLAPSLYIDVAVAAGQPRPASDATASPRWERVSSGTVLRWHDHRPVWHGRLPAEVDADPGRAHRLRDWSVPVRDGTRTLQLTGTLDWLPRPGLNRWWTGTLLAGAVVMLLAVSTAPRLRWAPAAVAFAVGLTTLGYSVLVALDNALPGIAGLAVALLSEVLPLLAGAAAMAAGAALLTGRPVAGFAAAVAGLLAVATAGVTNAAVFAHAVPPVPFDGGWARLAVAAILAGGLGLAGAGLWRLLRDSVSVAPPPVPPPAEAVAR
jgi:hypothetical protein